MLTFSSLVWGTVENNKSVVVAFMLPEFSPTLEVEWECDVLDDTSNAPYGMIIGSDVLKLSKMDIYSSDLSVSIGDIKVHWQTRNAKGSCLFNTDADMDDEAADRLKNLIVPKKDRTVRFLAWFKELNKHIELKTYPTPKIQGLVLLLEESMFATPLDLNMECIHILLTPFSRNLCTIVLPWEEYRYIRLPIELKSSLDVFSRKDA